MVCTGQGALEGLRLPWGVTLEVHRRIAEVGDVLGDASGMHWGSTEGGGAVQVSSGGPLGGCIGGAPRPHHAWPCPQPVCVSPHAAAAPPRCARCCHMRVNVLGPVHPSGRIHHPAARGARSDARVSRSPCAATDGGGRPLRPKNLGKHRLRASLELGSGIFPPRLHPCSIWEPVGRSRALVAQSPTRATARPGPPERLRLPAPSPAGPSSPGAGVTQPVCPLPPLSQPVRSSSSSSCLHPSQESFLRGHLHHFGGFAQGTVTPFQRKEGEKQPKPEARQSCYQTPFPGGSSPAGPTMNLSGIPVKSPDRDMIHFRIWTQ